MNVEERCEIIRNSRPILRYCERFSEGSEKWDMTKHAHPFIELIYYMDGRAALEVGGRRVDASIFDTLVYPANCAHFDALSGERRREIICLWVELPELVFERPLLLHEQGGMLRELFKMIHAEGSKRESDPYIVEYLLKLLLTAIVRQAYIHEHFAEKLTLEALASLAHISVSYLTRKFRQYTGTTVVCYVNRLRVEAAKRLLIATDGNAAEIAWQVGFESPKYFHRVFKVETGESPTTFRRAYQGNREGAPAASVHESVSDRRSSTKSAGPRRAS